MPAPPPLTHHDIFGLVEPFAAAGLQVDLAASDRVARTVRFKPVPVGEGPAAALPDGRPLAATLQLDCPAGGRYTLTRVLAAAGEAPVLPAPGLALQATLSASGDRPDELLALVQAVPPQHQFGTVGDGLLARSYRIASATRIAAGLPPLVLTRGVLRLPALGVVLQVIDVRGAAADLTLEPAPGTALDLPEDLLAVLGWNWARLVPAQGGWTTKLRLRGTTERRTAAAEQGLARLAQHLSRVLAEPPQRFHERHRAARWGVVLRRSIPTLTALGLIGGALMLPRIADPGLSGAWMALHYVPIALLALSFTLQELSRFEIPRPPRRLRQPSWQRPAGRGTGADRRRGA